MAQSPLIEYIEKARAGGMADEQIRQVLVASQWPVQDVDQAFMTLSQVTKAMSPMASGPSLEPHQALPVQSQSPLWGRVETWLFVVISLCLIGYLGWFFFAPAVKYAATEGPQKCEQVTNRTGPNNKLFCYTGEAVKAKDPAICKGLQNANEYGVCLIEVAAVTKDKALCNEFQAKDSTNILDVATAEGARTNCLSRVAIASQDLELCQSITGTDETSVYDRKATCLLHVAVSRQDEKICGLIPDKGTYVVKYECYQYVASVRHDAAICSNIPDQLDSFGTVANGGLKSIKNDCQSLQPLPGDIQP